MAKTVMRLATILAAAIVAPAETSAGEPQILGLIATLAPVPMTCGADVCSVEVSAFCLQQHAAVPDRGTPYGLPAGVAQRVTVEGQTAAGDAVTLPSSLLRLASARGNRAMEVSVGADVVADFGATALTLTVGDNVSAVPAALLADADDPATAQEIALTTGLLRELGSRLVDHGGESVHGARLLAHLVNAVPNSRLGDVPDRQGLWEELIKAHPGNPSVDIALPRFEQCATLPGGGFITFRECLAAQHDMLINPMNRDYWDAVDTGS